MTIVSNAFYYEDNYYLLPNKFPDYSSFLDAVHNGTLPMELHAIPLREDHGIRNFSVTKGRSMAPYFLRGYNDAPCSVVITNADNIYPVHAEIYSQEEYNAKLRELILKNCPGCLRYKPLSNRVQSLNGHFEEMSLDGVCLFRQETKPSPRVFHNHLFSFGGFYMRFNFFDKSASEMLKELKTWFYVRYANAELMDSGTHKELILTGRKKEILLPVLTNAIADYLNSITNHAYSIRYTDHLTDIQEWLDNAVSDENEITFQQECKKYGVSIGVLEYDADAAEKIRKSLKPMADHFWMFPLFQTDGKEYYLLADTSYVLKELRYRSPMLQSYHTRIGIYGQQGNKSYEISFDMLCSEL